jgi:hypothetical protein
MDHNCRYALALAFLAIIAFANVASAQNVSVNQTLLASASRCWLLCS